MPHSHTGGAEANGQCVDGSLATACLRYIYCRLYEMEIDGETRKRVARRACTKYTIHTPSFVRVPRRVARACVWMRHDAKR
ncbi:hypothetical protein LSTR_LSTR003954 [Laodelphax striatellus]|uniref:Uncharacterized protein n=1 Tax=Laodelphax striatellus TaxID=195883 RepID=A0A482X225_LAOST|nr:hypothetical protein LSTR_LSTR003954 [Laodelphax striatellus]